MMYFRDLPKLLPKVRLAGGLTRAAQACAWVCALASLLGWGGAAFAQTATATSTTLTITNGSSAVTTVASGTVVTLTATVAAGTTPVTPGVVNFCDATAAHCEDLHIVGTAQITSAGTAIFKFRPGVGSQSYKAVFVGTKTYTGSSSSTAALTVAPPVGGYPTSTTIASSGTSDNYTLTATVARFGNPSSPGQTGTVSFLNTSNANSVLATAPLGTEIPSLLRSTVATGSAPGFVASADFNGDGIPDLAVSESGSDSVFILSGNGDGTFMQAAQTPSLPGAPYLISTGDFNNDGIPDLAVIYGTFISYAPPEDYFTVAIMLGSGNGAFTLGATYTVGVNDNLYSFGVADFNQDGNLDLIIPNTDGVMILLGNGDGTFTKSSVSAVAAFGVAVADFNGDGIPDLAVTTTGSGVGVSILLGNGDGTFTPEPTSDWPEKVAGVLNQYILAADFNGDGKADLAVVTNGQNRVSIPGVEIFLGQGDGTFVAPPNPVSENVEPGPIAVGDFNEDGFPDLATEGGVMLGAGDGTFASPVNYPGGSIVARNLAVADFNGDGDPDLAAAAVNYNGVTIFLTGASASATASGISITGLGADTYQADASYSGDSNYAASVSSSITLYDDTPSAVSVSPSSGFGTTQQFSFVASSPNGAGDLAFVNMVFNTMGSPVNGCDLTYVAAGNQLSLLSDDRSTSTSGQPGATGTLSNSQCSVDLSATTVTVSGNTLTIAPTITFKSGFKAGLQIYMFVQDVQGITSGWKTMGWWMVGSSPESAPSAVSVSPSSGFGTTQQFSFVASSPDGAGNLTFMNMVFNTMGSPVNGCDLTYVAAGNQLSLLSDDHSTSTSGQPGATGTLSNSQCSVNLSATTVTAIGNTLTVAPTITFKSGFKAGIQIYMYVQDIPGMNSGWKTMGWWMVGSLAEQPPSAVSVSPSSGFGTTEQFSFVASSPNGAGNLAEVKMLFNTTLYRVNGCYLTYLAAGNQLSLLSDDGTTSTSGQPGATGTLSNSQCSVNLSATTVTASGNTLTVAPTITFTSGFNAGTQAYMYVADVPGMNSGWKKMSP